MVSGEIRRSLGSPVVASTKPSPAEAKRPGPIDWRREHHRVRACRDRTGSRLPLRALGDGAALALGLYFAALLVWSAHLRHPGPARAGDRLDLRRAGLRLARPAAAADPAARARLAADRRRPRRLRPHPRRRRLARDRRPRAPDDRLRPLPLLRRDPDRMAPVPPLRARRRQLVGRRLHARLHLLLHRPVRARRRPLGTRPPRLPALRQAPRLAGARRPRDLHRLPRGAALDGGGSGPARRSPPDHRRRAGKRSSVGTAGALLGGPGQRQRWSPPSPRCTPPSRRWSRCSSGAGCARACGRCWRSIRWRWA